jgi:excisionase family DNA binding protein
MASRPHRQAAGSPTEIGDRHAERVAPRLDGRLALRISEAAEALGVCENTLRRLITHEGLPVVRAGGVVLVPVETAREWLQKRARAEPDRVERAVRDALSAVDLE